MFPKFEILGYSIGTYGLLSVIGCILCGLVLCRLFKKYGLMIEDGILIIMIILVGVFIGGHLLYAITNFKYIPFLFESAELDLWLKRARGIFGGSVFYGGLFGGMIAGLIGCRLLRINTKLFADLMSPIIPLFHTFGRIGCFLAGCCFGIESEFGFITYTNEFVPTINGVVRFPVQLLEAVCNLALSALLFVLLAKREKNKLCGRLIYVYLISYGVIRFCDEFLRGDLIRGFVGILSTSQFISVISVSVGIFLLCRSFKSTKDAFCHHNKLKE